MNVQRASIGEERSGVETVIANAPPAARRAINLARARRGLPQVFTAAELEARLAGRAAHQAAGPVGPGVWVPGPRGSLVSSSASSSARRPTASSRSSTSTIPFRVVLIPAYGDAASTREAPGGEYIAPGAFGDAAALNAERGAWSVKWNHDGPTLAGNGSRLRAVDTGTAGPVLVWDLDVRSPMFGDILAAFNAAGGTLPVSVAMFIHDMRSSPLAAGAKWITRADLRHVAILADGSTRPLYAGAVAVMRKHQKPDDLRAHIDAAISAARFRDRQAKGYA